MQARSPCNDDEDQPFNILCLTRWSELCDLKQRSYLNYSIRKFSDWSQRWMTGQSLYPACLGIAHRPFSNSRIWSGIIWPPAARDGWPASEHYGSFIPIEKSTARRAQRAERGMRLSHESPWGGVVSVRFSCQSVTRTISIVENTPGSSRKFITQSVALRSPGLNPSAPFVNTTESYFRVALFGHRSAQPNFCSLTRAHSLKSSTLEGQHLHRNLRLVRFEDLGSVLRWWTLRPTQPQL